jgi:hypothetical protein
LKKYFKIPPNLPFPKGGETLSPFEKGGLRGIFESPLSGRLALFKQLRCYKRPNFVFFRYVNYGLIKHRKEEEGGYKNILS